MKNITFDQQSYFIDGKRGFFYSGELHYFRVPKADWKKRMELLREAGGNCVATYIPWLIHEPVEGKFVFGGEGHLDLEGFLQVAQEVGLGVIARPGPYQYSELVYGGIPRWLDNYPALFAKKWNGDPICRGAISYVHPLFLEKVRDWFDVVCPILARYTVSRGGSIVFTQWDNEAMGYHIWNGSLDYNPETMGFCLAEGRFTRWLRQRYPDIAQLNLAYDGAYRTFEQVRPISPELTARPSDVRRKKDYFEFYLSTVAEYACTLVAMMRQHGIDTTFVHNAGGFEMNANFPEIVEALDDDFLLGSDYYYCLDQTWRQNNPTPQLLIYVFFGNEMLRLMGFPPTVFELSAGSLSDWPPVTARDLRAFVFANLALGMKGCNYYVFTGGMNPPGAGTTSDLYDYGAPVGPNGEIRPHYEVVKDVGHFVQQHAWLAQAERVHDFRVGLDFDYNRAKHYGSPSGCEFSSDQAWTFIKQGILTTAFCSSLSPIFVDLSSDDWLHDTLTPLVVACAETIGRAKQERIVRFLKNGGRVLITPVLPRWDENLQPCSVLADYLQNPEVEANTGRQVRITCGPVVNILDTGRVFFTRSNLPSAKTLGIDELSDRAIAWTAPTSKGGQVIFLGFHWNHGKNEHSHMLKWLLGELGLVQQVVCSNPNIWTSLRCNQERTMLFLMNLGTSEMETDVSCLSKSGELSQSQHIVMEGMSVKAIEILAE